ncbi:iron-sulfur cluster assembly scaffold protein [Parvularcula flava]|uniref:Iron-sulfur cluster assembly scaffold protein n=1 Tax=Aquisalinus luteolus TaxID=1566827 RepID=A0A8J3A8P8_9PROT|nr:iron-sulfur cluster assembly scaffold protein [Aquisalinus luteolus]NHK28574.1 iron-sulfur cluster assembly scaffold protein [Aquisalinus luteolus]GGH98886.1 iron-sulfur cluster assembly scaffold protein [Aquisalinus luteolus]
MIEKIYSNALLEAAGSIPKARRLDEPDATARKYSRVCGSEVTVDLKMVDGVVSDFAVSAKACALGQASSSLMAKTIIGSTPDELRTLHAQMVAMLKEEGPVPTGERFAELSKLEPIRDYPARHASTLLVFDAVIDCLDQIDADKA